MSFPVGASVGDKYTLGNIQYEFNGIAWDLAGSVAGNAVEELESRVTTNESSIDNIDTRVTTVENNKLDTTDLLTEMKAVDGEGSGLDADTVDGVQGALLGVGGAGYAWVDETNNREVGTTYTNTTGGPLQLGIACESDEGDDYFTLTVSGVGINSYTMSSYEYGQAHNFYAIVPDEATYELAFSGTTVDSYTWLELKQGN